MLHEMIALMRRKVYQRRLMSLQDMDLKDSGTTPKQP
jgi:hypothetical protein